MRAEAMRLHRSPSQAALAGLHAHREASAARLTAAARAECAAVVANDDVGQQLTRQSLAAARAHARGGLTQSHPISLNPAAGRTEQALPEHELPRWALAESRVKAFVRSTSRGIPTLRGCEFEVPTPKGVARSVPGRVLETQQPPEATTRAWGEVVVLDRLRHGSTQDFTFKAFATTLRDEVTAQAWARKQIRLQHSSTTTSHDRGALNKVRVSRSMPLIKPSQPEPRPTP